MEHRSEVCELIKSSFSMICSIAAAANTSEGEVGVHEVLQGGVDACAATDGVVQHVLLSFLVLGVNIQGQGLITDAINLGNCILNAIC